MTEPQLRGTAAICSVGTSRVQTATVGRGGFPAWCCRLSDVCGPPNGVSWLVTAHGRAAWDRGCAGDMQ